MNNRVILKGQAIPVLDKGWLLLRDFLGSDLDIVQTARESTTADSKGDEKDKVLLDYLYKSGHVSPFAYPQIAFRMYMPIFVARQFVRHWSLSRQMNEMSGRYITLPEDNYVPSVWRKQGVGQSSELGFTDAENTYITGVFEQHLQMGRLLEHQMRENDVAKEMARLPHSVSQYTRISVIGSLRDWLWGFLRQRLDSHAQDEIREYAYAVGHFLNLLFPNTLQLFYKYTLGDLKFVIEDFSSLNLTEIDDIRKKIDIAKSNRDEIWKNVINQSVFPFEVVLRRQR